MQTVKIPELKKVNELPKELNVKLPKLKKIEA